jgi:hypothetical protein
MSDDENRPDDTISLGITNPNLAIPEKAIRAYCMKWKIRSFRFFGSIMRDDFRPDSDIDVLVEYRPDACPSFFTTDEMKEELEHLFGRRVDLANRRSVEESHNYIRKKGILSGKPPVLRQMSYLLDMLIQARAIQKLTVGNLPDIIDSDEIVFHALSFNVCNLAGSSGRVDSRTRDTVPEIPWDILDAARITFEEDLFPRDKHLIRNIAWEIVPHSIPPLIAIIPREDET